MTLTELKQKAIRALRELPDYKDATLSAFTKLAGDASTREYFRITLGDSRRPTQSLIYMNLSAAPGPVGGGKMDLSQDDTFVEVSRLFSSAGIPVPQILFDGRPESFLIVEDIGNTALWHYALREEGDPKDIPALYKQAIDVIAKIQALKPKKDSIIATRKQSFEQYRTQIARIEEHILEEAGITAQEQKVIGGVFDSVSEAVAGHRKVPVHYDYMSYNVYVRDSKNVVVLDFQDACMDSPVRDIVALINDRDIDAALGSETHHELLSYAKDTLCTDGQFERQYLEYLFQWDCRVSGLFHMLSHKKKREMYSQWIAGTLSRIGVTANELIKYYPKMADTIEIFTRYAPDVGKKL